MMHFQCSKRKLVWRDSSFQYPSRFLKRGGQSRPICTLGTRASRPCLRHPQYEGLGGSHLQKPPAAPSPLLSLFSCWLAKFVGIALFECLKMFFGHHSKKERFPVCPENSSILTLLSPSSHRAPEQVAPGASDTEAESLLLLTTLGVPGPPPDSTASSAPGPVLSTKSPAHYLLNPLSSDPLHRVGDSDRRGMKEGLPQRDLAINW